MSDKRIIPDEIIPGKDPDTTVERWAEYLRQKRGINIHQETIRLRLKNDKEIKELRATIRGRVYKSYAMSDVFRVLADLLPSNNETYLQILASYGINDWITFFSKSVEWYIKNDFPPYGKGAAFIAKILGRPIGPENNLSRAHLIEVAKILGFEEPTEEEKRRSYCNAIASHGIITYEDLINDGPRVFREKEFPPYGKGIVFFRYITGISKKHVEAQDMLTIAKILQLPHEKNDKEKLPRADASGFFVENGIRFGSCFAWSKFFNLKNSTVFYRLEKSKAQKRRGKSSDGQTIFFYAEDVFRKIFSDLIDTKHQIKSDPDGFLTENDVRFGMCHSWAKSLDLAESQVKKRLENVPFIKRRSHNGRPSKFYSENDVRKRCDDLLKQLPQADEYGFFVKENVRYGTYCAWARLFQITPAPILKRLKRHNVKGIEGRSINGKTYFFYPEPEILKVCSDIISV